MAIVFPEARLWPRFPGEQLRLGRVSQGSGWHLGMVIELDTVEGCSESPVENAGKHPRFFEGFNHAFFGGEGFLPSTVCLNIIFTY